MESLRELTSLASVVLDSGFDFEAFSGWKVASFLVCLSLASGFHHYALNLGHLTEPGQRLLITGQAVTGAAQQRLSSRASGFKANRLPTGIVPSSILPQDLTSRRNF